MSQKEFQFMGLSVKPGAVMKERIPISEFADQGKICLPVTIINGEHPGPVLLILAGIHGDETTGVEIARSVVLDIDPKDLNGTIISIPVANPPSYLTKNRSFLVEERALIDMNRVFPGNSGGLLTERIAHLIMNEILPKATYCIDLHSALRGCNIMPFTYVNPDDDENNTLKAREQMAKAFGTSLVYYKKRGSKLGTSDVQRTISIQADSRKIPIITAEMGESGRITWEFVKIGVRGVKQVLISLKMLPGNLSVVEQQRFTEIKLVHSNRGGLLHTKVGLGEEVKQGQVIAQIVGLIEPEPIEMIKAPCNGTVLRLMDDSAIYPGAEIAWVVH